MNTITIPKKITKGEELVIIPRKEYEEFLGLERIMKGRSGEKSDTDLAIKIYKKEKRQGKLKIIKSLAGMA